MARYLGNPSYFRPDTSAGDGIQCTYHPEAPLIDDSRAGDQICSECGLVVQERVLDVSSEWRTFSNDTSGVEKNRVGGPENHLLGEENLTTTIGVGRGAASFDASGCAKYTNKRNINNTDKAMISAMRDIKNMADKIHLPRTITDRANNIFKSFLDKRGLRGMSTQAVATACLYIACRQEDVPRTFKEICAISGTSKRDIGRCFKIVKQVVGTTCDVVSSSDFMSRFCGNLGLNLQIQRAATRIALRAANINGVEGKSPISVAAAAIFMASQASNIKKSALEVGTYTGVAESTLKQAYRILLPHAASLFPENFAFVTPINQLPKL